MSFYVLDPEESSAETIGDSVSWYAIRVQSKFEKLVSTALRGKGYEEWLPMYRCHRQWCDRLKEIDLPLFPGYVFCRFDVRERLLPILTTPGVVKIVSAGRTPIPVSCEEIAAVQAILRSGLAAQPWPYLAAGSKVVVERGPLAGVEGIVLSVEKEFRLIVSISLLQRAVAVQLGRECVRPIANSIDSRPAVQPESLRVAKHVA